MKETFWKPVGNREIRTKPRRHHNVLCPFCLEKKKNINLHYRLYHPEENVKDQRAVMSGEIGVIYGVKFCVTSNGLE